MSEQPHQQQQQHLLSDLLATAASSKDNAGTRAGDAFHPLLTLLTASSSEAWFKPWLAEQLSSTYPRASRSLLDAVLQAFIAASPLHCGHVLPSLLALPGSDTLSTPLRRDLAALFRPNPVLHSVWQQQGAVCCSVVGLLATAAADAVHTWWSTQPQQQQQLHIQEAGSKHHHCTAAAQPAAAAQAAGTAIGWLTDCLLQAVPQHKLALLQLAVAVFVQHSSTLGQQQQQQQQQQQWGCDGEAGAADPPAKRRRLQQQQGQQSPTPPLSSEGCGNSKSSHSGGGQQQPSLPAAAAASLEAGLQFLAALCSCEAAQCSNSQQLLPLAAVVAAQAAAAGPEQSSTCVHSPLFRWMLLQLCCQVSASSAVPAGNTGPAGGGVGPGNAGGSPGVPSAAAAVVSASTAQFATPQQQQQQPLGAPTPPGLSPAEALQLVVGHLVSAGPTQALQAVCSLISAPLQGGTAGAEGGAGTAAAVVAAVPTPSEAAAAPAAAAAASLATYQVLLLEAAKQWQAAPSQADSGNNSAAGSTRGGRGRGRAGRAGVQRAVPAVLQLEQLMPAAAPVTASWVCKHIAACLCQQASKEWRQQQQQQKQRGEQEGADEAGAFAALLQLLTADGLLLPASGEVLVSARALAGALCSMPDALQQQVARSWQQALLSRQQAGGGGPAATETAAAPLLPWPTLQPMLCLLNHLGELQPPPPFAAFLGACLRSCTSAAHAAAAASGGGGGCSGSGAGGRSGSSSSSGSTVVSEVLRHLLLPLRFKLQVHARVWLLQQLLLEGVQDCSSEGAVQADSPAGGLAAAAESAAVLEALVALLKQGPVAGQLSQGLQLLVAERQDTGSSSQGGNKAGAAARAGVLSGSSASTLQSGQARDLADALVQLVSQLQQQQGGGAAAAGGRLKEVLLHNGGGGNGCVVQLLEPL